MSNCKLLLTSLFLAGGTLLAQDKFVVTGTPIPADLLAQNYGRVPKGIGAYDLNICNVTDSKESVVSSAIYQALSQSTALQPIGREIMLASILHNQNRSLATILSVALNSFTGVLSVFNTKSGLPPVFITGAALGSLAGQQLLTNLKPVLSVDQVEKFENQVLEPALVLDGGSCVERTVFTAPTTPKTKQQSLNFRVQ